MKGNRISTLQGVGLPWSGRWLILALALFYPTVVYGGALLKSEYSHISQYISELNAVGTAWSWQIGYLGFLPLGVLGLAAWMAVASRLKLAGASKVGYWLLLAEPVVYAGSAFAPCDLGCPSTGSLSQNVHNILSGITLLVTTAGLVLLFFNNNLSPTKRVGWLVLATIFLGFYALALAPDLAPWRGLLQRLAEGILYGCLCIVGWQISGERAASCAGQS